MRIIAMLASALLTAPFQEDPDLGRIRELVEGLDDDRIERREAATESLEAIDLRRLPLLRDSLLRLNGEARERLLGVVQKLELRLRLGQVLPRPSLITLPDKDLRVRDILDLIRKQTKTQITVEAGLKGLDDSIRLPLAGVPLWEALDRLCLRHGRLSLTDGGNRVSLLDKGRQVKTGLQRGALTVWLEQLSTETSRILGSPDLNESCQLQLVAAWEAGGGPSQIRTILLNAVEDNGRVLVEEGEEVVPSFPLAAGAASECCRIDIMLPELPSPEALKLARLRLRVEFHYPVERHEIRIETPFPLSAPRTGGTSAVSATLKSMGTDEGPWHGILMLKQLVQGQAELILESARMIDKDGKGWDGIFPLNLAPEEPGTIDIPVTFASMPPKSEPRRLELKVITRTHVEVLDLDLRDLPLAAP